MQAFEKTGLWWLPSNPERAVAGILSFSQDRKLSLRLMGTLKDKISDPLLFGNLAVLYPLILGVTNDDRKVTLHHCVQREFQRNSTGFTSQGFMVRAVYSGEHFADEAGLVFNDIFIQYTHLQDWANISGFSLTIPTGTEIEPREYIASYVEPSDMEMEIPGGQLRLTSTLSISPNFPTVSMSQSTYMVIHLKQAIPFSDWLKSYISPLQDLLSLATCRPNAVTHISFHVDGKSRDAGTPIQKDNVELIFEPVFYEKEETRKNILPMALFTLKDLENPSATINRWLQSREEIRIVNNLFFGLQYGPARYLDARFLTTIQAVEMYHRNRYPNNILPASEYKEMVKTIVNTAPQKDRKWLKEQLAYSNEPRLRQRVVALLSLAWDIMEPLVKDENRFAKKVTDTRNYYTHYNPSLSTKAAQNEDLYWVNEALLLLLQRCYLHELHFSSEKCVALFAKNQRYQNVLLNTKSSGE